MFLNCKSTARQHGQKLLQASPPSNDGIYRFVNPQILSVAGMDIKAVFVTTCLIAAIGSILMGLLANLPIAVAPAMGLNAFFVVVGAMGYSWQVAMGAVFWGQLGYLF